MSSFRGSLQLTAHLSENPTVGSHCKKCGAQAIDNCPDCDNPIQGLRVRLYATFTPPEFCHNCGKPYPWKGKTVDVTEQSQAKWVKWTSPLYWFLVIKSKSLAAFIRLRGHNWTRVEVMPAIAALIAALTLVSMWLIYWR